MNIQPQYPLSPGSQEVWDVIKATDLQIKNISQEIRNMSRETDQQIKTMAQETDKKFRETDKGINRLERLFEGQWGKLMEIDLLLANNQ